jgi:hypothetical protein
MYETYKSVFYKAIDTHKSEVLLPYKKQINRGFEAPLTIKADKKEYTFRMIIIFDQGLFARRKRTLDERIKKTKTAFAELKLNKYKLKTQSAIDEACASILEKYQTSDYFTYCIHNSPIITYKNKKRGRSPKNKPVEKTKVVKNYFSVKLNFTDEAYPQALYKCGYYPLITNKAEEDFSIEDAMMAHKQQYKSEHTYRRAKSGLKLEPIYLHKPGRIESYLLLFKMALQLIVLIERTARQNIERRDKGLDGFMPNRNDVRNPKTEYLLAEFQYIVSGNVSMPEGSMYYFVSELNDLQKDILQILEVPIECFTYEYLFDSS